MKTLLLSLCLAATAANAQSVLYEFPGLNEYICVEFLNPCDTSGCSVCNRPMMDMPSTFIGTNVVWHNVDACPHGDPFGDGHVRTVGWPAMADSTHFILLSVLAFAPMNIDSIVIGHWSDLDGPTHFMVEWEHDAGIPDSTIADEVTSDTPGVLVLTNLGCVQADSGAAYGVAQLALRPYLAGAGGWNLDYVRIYASPCMTTSVQEYHPERGVCVLGGWNVLGQRAHHNTVR